MIALLLSTEASHSYYAAVRLDEVNIKHAVYVLLGATQMIGRAWALDHFGGDV